MAHRLRRAVFWVPFGGLLATALASILLKDEVYPAITATNAWVLDHFGSVFSYAAFGAVLLVAAVWWSPIARIRIGGAQAKPILSRWKWFSITLCTTIATGILFWGTAEPLYHLQAPPTGLGLEPHTVAARDTAMSTMFLHWTITPYALYTVMGLTFALGYYNLHQPFSLGTLLYPLLGKRAHGRVADIVDMVCLYALVAGMSASLGAGILTISGGLLRTLGWESGPGMYAGIGALIVGAFCISAGTGLLKGIRLLSDYNIRAFVLLAVFVLLAGPTAEMLSIGWAGLQEYIVTYIPRSLNVGQPIDDSWLGSWSVFYWANWMAWAPVTALFLGRISYGYTVREFIGFNLLLTSLFGGVWMMIFSGAALHFDLSEAGTPLSDMLTALGPESIIYGIFERLPGVEWVSVVFLFIVFLSYVTAADSNTSAMSGISMNAAALHGGEAPLWVKVSWGILIGLVTWVMIAYDDINGLRIISTLGGFPALPLLLLVMLALGRMMLQPGKMGLKA